MYIIKQLFVYDEKCVIYKKIIIDKIDDNNFFPISDITNFMNNNHKCFFNHVNCLLLFLNGKNLD